MPAMLSKQIWRLISEPESFCARVLRRKYYPYGKILDAKLKKGSSFTWQSIMTRLQTFKKGAIWRVGDGHQISIWDDAWIPLSPTGKVFTSKGNILLKNVNELIDAEGNWDEELLREIFWSIDVNNILSILLKS
jgi:hypothetical protein